MEERGGRGVIEDWSNGIAKKSKTSADPFECGIYSHHSEIPHPSQVDVVREIR